MNIQKHFTFILLTMTAGTFASAQVIEDWQFGDANGTGLSSAANSVGTTSWGSGSGSEPTVQSGQLDIAVTLDGTWYADVADISSGIYQLDVTGVTFGSISGGSNDHFSFGFTEDTGSSNERSWDVLGSNSRDKAMFVLGNENDSGGLDALGFSQGTTFQTSATDLTSDFTGTFDFRILWDATNQTVDFSWQRNGGGYSAMGSQLSYLDTDAVGYLLLDFDMNNSTGSDSAQLGAVTLTAIPEPSSLLMVGLAGIMGFLTLRRRR